ncbi:MAG: sigma-70 family RNA polymerase sigma factor [Cyclobacteriaceae bacterium]|nr:sigma-70 family RNA polymerase sigma factor [Cyclobacteriaceae bacterium]
MNQSQTLDELLVIRCKEGDGKAFALLVKRWQPKILRHAYRMTGESAVAKDVAQETWIAAIKGISNLRDPAVFKVWIYRIASNKCVSWIRSRQKHRRMAEYVRQNPEDKTPIEEDDKMTRLRLELQDLPDNQKVVLTLFYLENQSMHEISQSLGVPVGTVKSRLYHAREQLKKRYYEKYEKT